MKIVSRRFLSTAGLAAAISIFTSACGIIPGTSAKSIPPGYVGLKIQLYGKNRGVQNATISTGRVWYNGYTEEVVVFPVTFSITS